MDEITFPIICNLALLPFHTNDVNSVLVMLNACLTVNVNTLEAECGETLLCPSCLTGCELGANPVSIVKSPVRTRKNVTGSYLKVNL